MSKAAIFGGLKFEAFKESDINTFTPVMKAAFDHDVYVHTGKKEGGPTGYDNGDLFRKYYLDEDFTSFKISKNGKSVGGLCVKINTDKINYLANIFIDPKMQGQNLGKIIWDFAEQTFPDTIKWTTETPAFSRRNHHFYVNKCGFKIVRIGNPKSDDDTGIYFMEKDMNYT